MSDKYILWAPSTHLEEAIMVDADHPALENMAEELMHDVYEGEVFLYKLVPVRKYELPRGVKVTEIEKV